jgi:hypothetical protein
VSNKQISRQGVDLLITVLRRLGLGFFAILVLFWVATLFNCAFGFFDNGLAGARHELLRHTSEFSFDQQGRLRFREHSAALRYGINGLLTLLLGFVNRATLARLYTSLRQGLRTRFNTPNQQ